MKHLLMRIKKQEVLPKLSSRKRESMMMIFRFIPKIIEVISEFKVYAETEAKNLLIAFVQPLTPLSRDEKTFLLERATLLYT